MRERKEHKATVTVLDGDSSRDFDIGVDPFIHEMTMTIDGRAVLLQFDPPLVRSRRPGGLRAWMAYHLRELANYLDQYPAVR